MKVLDHGFVKLRNIAGPTRRAGEIFDASDVDVAQAARMSFEQMDSARTYEADLKLARYLMEHHHDSPFEMIQVWVEVKVPIFVDRQLVRHRAWSRNESSGRYITLPEEFYIPEVVRGRADNVKQGSADNLSGITQDYFRKRLREQCEESYQAYLFFLEKGVAPEVARMFLHVNHYVHWLGRVDLRNLFSFLRLRLDKTAQWEARQYAAAILELIRPHLPGLVEMFR